MSAIDTTAQITGLADGTPAVTYVVPGQQVFTLIAVRATFDGTGAAGAFLPCVKILSSAGTVMAQTVGSSVAAGASADATFAPFLEMGATAAGTGIQFDTDNEGGWFELGSGNSIPAGDLAPFGVGIKDTSSGGGVVLWNGNVGGGVWLVAGPVNPPAIGGGGINLVDTAGVGVTLNAVGAVVATGGTVSLGASGGIALDPDNALSGTAFLTIANLPVVNPGGTGIVWNNAGVLNIT